MNHEHRLRDLYAAFNSRDLDTTLAAMTEDVDWPNAWEGGRVHGREGVRDYWTRQWAEIDSKAEPIGFSNRPDGRIAVDVDLGEIRAVHVYTFDGDLIARMDVEEAAEG
jgi:hypothetical protein